MPSSAERWSAALDELAAVIRRAYVFPEQAEALASFVEELRRHDAWLGPTDEKTASAVTKALRERTQDWHFAVVVRTPTAEELALAPEDRWKLSMPGRSTNFGFRSVSVEDGVATLGVTALVPVEWSEPTAHAAMAFCRHAEAVLIDLRRCGGGDPDLIRLLCSYFLGDHPTPLSSVTWVETGEVETLITDPDAVSFRFPSEVKLYCVVGPRTASGAEALAYDLQAYGRATIVGTATLGAAHRIKQFDLAEGIVATVPSGKVTNPITTSDWEGAGVLPDVPALPDDALALALAAARA